MPRCAKASSTSISHASRMQARRAALLEAIAKVLADVRVCVRDWRPMLAKVSEVIADIKNNPPPLPVDEIAEATQLLEWLVANNFTFLGLREYGLRAVDLDYEPLYETGLGIMRARDVQVLRRGSELVSMTPEIMAFLREPKALIITKANVRSRVHRRVYMDYVGVKRFDDEGRLIGEVRIVGLFTSTAYTRSPRTIPYLRRKVDAVSRRSGFDPDSHSGKALANVLETYLARRIVPDRRRDAVPVRARHHASRRAPARARACAPRPFRPFRFGLRLRPARALRLVDPHLPSAPISPVSSRDASRLSTRSFRKARSSAFTSSSAARRGKRRTRTARRSNARSKALCAPGPTGLPRRSRSSTIPSRPSSSCGAIATPSRSPIGKRSRRRPRSPTSASIENLSKRRPLGVDFYRKRGQRQDLRQPQGLEPREADPVVRARAGARKHGLQGRRRTHLSDRAGRRRHDGDLAARHVAGARRTAAVFDLEALERAARSGLHGGLAGPRRERRLQRAGALCRPAVARRGAAARRSRVFCGKRACPIRRTTCGARSTAIRASPRARSAVPRAFRSAADPVDGRAGRARGGDRRRDRGCACGGGESRRGPHPAPLRQRDQSAVRTNFYQLDPGGQPKPTIAIKFESRKLDELPLPKPLYEIFVYSPRVEGVHLRFGKVARGGIRWSDRPQDFRTEVLGLVKAQQVKNAVIVPVGAKGGFVPKHMPAGAPARRHPGGRHRAYEVFVSSLLDITDNLGRRRPHPAGQRGAARRRRSLSRGRGRQGHGDVLRYRERHFDRSTASGSATPSLGRLGRLRPQGDGHHGARRVGGGEAAFPRNGCRYHDDPVHGRRRRRHVRRRVRQRHAARTDHQACRRLRSSRHLHRSRTRPGSELRRARAPVRDAAFELAGLRQVADLEGRRNLFRAAPRRFAVGDEAQALLGLAAEKRRRRRS